MPAYGGIGTVTGVIIGAVLMGVINLGMSVMGIDQNFQKVVKGLVLLAAVIFDVMSKKNDSRQDLIFLVFLFDSRYTGVSRNLRQIIPIKEFAYVLYWC